MSKKLHFSLITSLVLCILSFILIYFFIWRNEIFKNQIDFRYLPTNERKHLEQYYHFKLYPKRNYTKVTLTGNRSLDEDKLTLIRERIRSLIKTNDTLNGVHLH